MTDRTVMGGGSVTAPGAGATLASIAAGSLPAGVYRLTTYGAISGSAVADLGNMRLRRGGTDLVGSPIPCGSNGASQRLDIEGVELTGSQALDIIAIGAGTAGVEYNVTVEAIRTG